MKRYTTTLAIRKMQFTMKYHHTSIRMAHMKIVTAPNADKDTEKLDYSYTVGVNTK